ncbi:alpha/beta hydrolase [Flavobacterium sp. CYK-55]|uniref:alpha/beta hydrolase n=1 Tax=Flavobacterium sp. CYK-55 TaxID=2835529 RepID=UPI0020C131B9|nr:alpha/beta hydrolase-fold protein [Flavobacterium sp. CYK-55]
MKTLRIQLVILVLLWVGLPVSAQENRKPSTASAQVSTFVLEAPQLNTQRKIWLYLPQDYKTSKKRYPVIYAHDAQNLFDSTTSFAGEWNLDEKLDSLKAQVIVVGIENGGDKRLSELTPYPHEKYGGGKGDAYLDFIVHTLKPKIDAEYRSQPQAKNTVIMGSSLGGLISFYALLKYPNVFGKAAVFSPAFWINRKPLLDLMQQTQSFKSKVYFLCGDNEGDEDMIRDLNTVEHWVNTQRCSCKRLNKKVIVKGGQHNEKLWRDGFVKAYLWLK